MVEAKLMSPGEAARTLGIDVKTLQRWANDGQVTAVRTPGGHRRYLAAEIRLYSRLRAAGKARFAAGEPTN